MIYYYKLAVRSDYYDLTGYNTIIIVTKGFFYAREIMTGTRIMICDNPTQGSCHDYYVMSSDFTEKNIVRQDGVKKYIDSFDINQFPIYSKKEEKNIKQMIKKCKRKKNGGLNEE
jgi:hypothetical protein